MKYFVPKYRVVQDTLHKYHIEIYDTIKFLGITLKKGWREYEGDYPNQYHYDTLEKAISGIESIEKFHIENQEINKVVYYHRS